MGSSASARAIGTAEHYRWLEGIVQAAVVLNLLDAVLTLIWVQSGLAEELNALLRDLVNERAVAFVLAKLGLVSLGCLFLWRYRARSLAVVAIFLTFLIYYLVLLHHLAFLGGL